MRLVTILLLVACEQRGTTITVTGHGHSHDFVVTRPTPISSWTCEPPAYTIERLEAEAWVPIEIWARDPECHLHKETPGTPVTTYTWTGNTVHGPAPAGHYRFSVTGAALEFDLE